MTLLVADISSHNTITSWPAFLGSVDGLIVKISEGVGYTWLGAPNALTQARNAGKCVGVYHFASAGDPVAEANYFLSKYTHRPGEVIVLDWEPSGFTGDADAWCYAWCQRVIAVTGVVPMIYLNKYYATVQSQWPRTRSLNAGLWAAWYGANTGQPLPGMPSFAPWPSVAMWQYTSQGSRPGVVSPPLDLNQFYGTADAWRAYGTAGAPQPAPSLEEKHMRVIQQTDRGIGVIGPGYYYSMTADQVGPAVAAWGQPVIYNTSAEFDAAVASATRGGNLFDVWNKATTHYPYSDRVGAARPDSDDLDGQVLSTRAAVEEALAAVKSLGQAQAPTIDEAKLAAALAADPAAIDALGKAIAANLQLAPRTS